jgi:serine/threonine-protein kinase RsbW
MSSLTVPAQLDSMSAISSFTVAAADAGGLDRQARHRLRLAVDEFANNIISYAYADGSPPGTIDLHATVEDRTLTVTVEDTGVPFDPRQVPPPADLHLPPEQRRIGGLGIYLALGGVDRYSYERVGNRNRSIFIVNRPPIS